MLILELGAESGNTHPKAFADKSANPLVRYLIRFVCRLRRSSHHRTASLYQAAVVMITADSTA